MRLSNIKKLKNDIFSLCFPSLINTRRVIQNSMLNGVSLIISN